MFHFFTPNARYFESQLPQIDEQHDNMFVMQFGSRRQSAHLELIALYNTIRTVFTQLANKLIDLLRQHADKLSLCISDSVKYSPTFRWAFREEPILMLYFYYILMLPMNDLYGIFSIHIIKQKQITALLLPFLHQCSSAFKSNIWKLRSDKWKEWKHLNGLTKHSFKTYSQTFRTCDRTTLVRDEPRARRTRLHRPHIYTNPHWDFRNYKNHRDLLFILFSSSNFLHSGPFYSHLDVLSTQNINDLHQNDYNFISHV
jgi:hypothetical protein